MKKKVVTVYVVAVAAVLSFVLLAGCSKKSPEPEKNQAPEQNAAAETPLTKEKWGDAPDFTLPKSGGGTLTLSSLKGKVIILDFWSTRCPPCKREIPGFIELYNQYKDQGLVVVGASLDSEAAIKAFAQRTKIKINYPLVFADRKIGRQYGGIRYIPTTFIINSEGNIVKKHVGYVSKKVFEKEIKKLLNINPE